jgi:uridine monophosphate synthetase
MQPADQLESLILTLHDIGAVRFGDFVLHSGRRSPIYFDLRVLPSYPRALRQAAAVYRALLAPLSFDLIAATPLAGLPIGTAVSLELEVPLIYPRQTAKAHGTGKTIEGAWRPGQTAVMVDDLITSGDSLLQGIAALEAAGLRVSDAVVLIDRQQGGRAAVEARGYRLHSAVTLGDMLIVLADGGRIGAEQRGQVLAGLK